MKKLLSTALALVLTMSMSIVAFAADIEYTATEATTFTIHKTYSSDEDFVPGEILNFAIIADSENPDDSMISIGEDNSYTVAASSNDIVVTVPSFDTAGVYNWTIQEEQGNTAGVTFYDTEKTIYVTALVAYDNENNALIIENLSSFIKKVDGTKTDTFENVFQTNDFTVAKNVDGNMADEYDEFEITVTLTSEKPVLTDIMVGGTTVNASAWTESDGTYTYTTTLTLSEADGITTFADIPYGVGVSVVENTDVDKMNGYTQNGYTVNGNKVETVSFTIDDDNLTVDEVVVENTKSASVDTGITMDSIPYILLLAVACMGMFLFISKKNSMREF